MYPERFSTLPAYAFPRLRALLEGVPAGGDPLLMTIGEPKHAFPAWIADVLAENLSGFGNYPTNEGRPELLEACAAWVKRRYGVALDADRNFLALNGTREGLYNVGMALGPEEKNGQPVVLMPNPFYPVYMISAISHGAQSVFVPATAETGHLPDYQSLSEEVLNRTTLCYICSPANPQGAVASKDYWKALLNLAETYDFKVLADECYSEIYRDAPPPGILEVAHEMGVDPERVVAFHSLSKRSNVPGLRSGFAASGPENIVRMKQLRSYAGAPSPMPLQAVAAKLWNEESHVVENRRLYREKYAAADAIMADVPGYLPPEAGFFLWLPIKDGEAATLRLWRETGVKVLPGGYLSQDGPTGNPGQDYIRVAMVADLDQTKRGLETLRDCLFEVK
ncbi:MAG: aminotransferase class I/II-fold pyridoxal phosphate-dependent enzyme [Pseudomonadota bacterium]